jgi:hypothetical protein
MEGRAQIAFSARQNAENERELTGSELFSLNFQFSNGHVCTHISGTKINTSHRSSITYILCCGSEVIVTLVTYSLAI